MDCTVSNEPLPKNLSHLVIFIFLMVCNARTSGTDRLPDLHTGWLTRIYGDRSTSLESNWGRSLYMPLSEPLYNLSMIIVDVEDWWSIIQLRTSSPFYNCNYIIWRGVVFPSFCELLQLSLASLQDTHQLVVSTYTRTQ